MNRKEIRAGFPVENSETPLSVERVADVLSWEAAKFIVDVVASPDFSLLHIQSDKRHWKKAGEDALNTQLRLELVPTLCDLAYTKEIQRKAAAFEKEFGEAFKKNPTSFGVGYWNRDLILEFSRTQGRLQNMFIAELIDWNLV
jgi:hypothetical protein